MLTYSQRRSWAKHGDREIQRTIDQAKAELAAEDRGNLELTRATLAKRSERVPFTREQLESATHVRTTVGWHKVVRVSAKSVTVETGYSWTDRYAIAKILEVRTLV